MTGDAKIGAVILTYNSAEDLPLCMDYLLAQSGIDVRIVVVDNASAPGNLAAMEAAFLSRAPDGKIVNASDAAPEILAKAQSILVRNPQNAGYSAGNNVGTRLAVGAGCDAVLIVNPDVRIPNTRYLAELWRAMLTFPDCVVGASRVLRHADVDENPLRELMFWEEVFWVRQYLPAPLRPPPYVQPVSGWDPVVVQKLHGCCLMIRAPFLEAIGFLDEAVFLYSEEPILAAQVRAAGKRMMLFPHLSAVHAHVAATKGNSSRRMLIYIKSRLYYLRRYSGYGPAALATLRLSYALLSLLHAAKARVTADRPLRNNKKETAA